MKYPAALRRGNLFINGVEVGKALVETYDEMEKQEEAQEQLNTWYKQYMEYAKDDACKEKLTGLSAAIDSQKGKLEMNERQYGYFVCLEDTIDEYVNFG